MAEPELAHLPERVPSEVTLHREDLENPRFTHRELQLIREQFGRSFSEIGTDDKSDDRIPVIAWLKLRREGYTLTWEQMADVVIGLKVEADVDPTSAAPSTTSPPSASTTG
jgi:hypothetical protein